MGYLREQNSAHRKKILDTMVPKKIPCVVISRNLAPMPEMIESHGEEWGSSIPHISCI